MKPIKLKDSQYIDCGTFGSVYRISPRRIVKIFHEDSYTPEEIEFFIEDEIKGGLSLSMALPVLRVIEVICPRSKTVQKGLVKRYLPLEISLDEFKHDIRPSCKEKDWDAGRSNFRKDTRGDIWQIDTQTEECLAYC